ncbi:MAG: AMP-binding protein [Methylococcales bacterium]|nr:AMP-binding protein [Methylococcales bacterium]
MRDILDRLSQTPERLFLVFEDQEITYQKAIEKIQKYKDELTILNVNMVAIFADNQPDWVFIDLACQSLNICCIPLPLFFSPQQLNHAMGEAKVDLLLSDQAACVENIVQATATKQSMGKLSVYRVVHDDSAVVMPDLTAKITFTSGSTGQPKGVCLSRVQQWQVAVTLFQAVDQAQIKHLCVMPLSTLLENIAGIYAPILSAGTIYMKPLQQLGFNGSARFSIEKLLASITEVQPNTLILLPQLLMGLVGAVAQGWLPPKSLTFIAVGGGKTAKALIEQAQQVGLPVYEGYGLSECGSVVSLNHPKQQLPGSVGKPLPHAEVRIEDGEIVVAGSVYLGYLNDPESWQTKDVYTGDLGYFDESGFLYVNGRASQVLVSSYGRNINPEWVESEMLCGALLQQCVVFGHSQPYCIALVLPRKLAATEHEIQQWIDVTNARLPDYAQVRQWHRLAAPLSFVDGLLTSNGRPIRAAIANQFTDDINHLYC